MLTGAILFSQFVFLTFGFPIETNGAEFALSLIINSSACVLVLLIFASFQYAGSKIESPSYLFHLFPLIVAISIFINYNFYDATPFLEPQYVDRMVLHSIGYLMVIFAIAQVLDIAIGFFRVTKYKIKINHK